MLLLPHLLLPLLLTLLPLFSHLYQHTLKEEGVIVAVVSMEDNLPRLLFARNDFDYRSKRFDGNRRLRHLIET